MTSITYIGHATTLIEMDGIRLLTDPILRDRVSLLKRRGPSVDPSLYQNIDAVLISHLHYDHLDLPSLRMIGVDVPLIVPRGSARLFHRNGFQVVKEIRRGSIVTIGGLMVKATYARHNSFRFPFGLIAACLGFIIQGPYSIYFPGDTDIFPGMARLADQLDVALLPVWGWGPTLGSGHMDPTVAATALTLLNPRLAIPIHWGTLHPSGLGRLNPRRFLTDPPHIFARAAARLAPDVEVRIVSPGASTSMERSEANDR